MSAAASEIVVVVGARPNFMKAGPILAGLREDGRLTGTLVHTGQHYDERMSDLFFRQLGLPEPDVNLGVGSGTHGEQTAEVLLRFERYLASREAPAAVLVVGDVNSTLACALVAAKALVPLVHVEAGLRSFDRTMPEEVNRVVTDALAEVCYVTEASGVANLKREGKPEDSVLLAGNTMIDTLLQHLERAEGAAAPARETLGVEKEGYALCTLHRPSNVDHEQVLAGIVGALITISERLPVVWPIHPRTRERLRRFGLEARVFRATGLRVAEPMGYLEFLGLAASARLLLTDSGGIQEEAVVLRVPCVTLRENTERPVTVDVGGNVLAGSQPARVLAAVERMLDLDRAAITTPPLWDGRAAERIVRDLAARFAPGGRAA